MLSPSRWRRLWRWCRRRVGVGVNTYKPIDYNSYTHIVAPLIYDENMPSDKTLPCMSKF